MIKTDHKRIHIPKREIWIESREEFLNFDACDLVIEHSLFSISLWESKYHKPFINSDKSPEEMADYIRMMCVDDLVRATLPKEFFLTIPQPVLREIDDYIKDPMTATTISEDDEDSISKPGGKKEILTAELLYYYMTTQNIPFECEMWHINRLIMLIKVCGIKNQPEDSKKKKMTSSDLARRRARMQAARAKYAKH